ncbi:MAG: ABC transporter substrate-binding protein [Anaerolineales bacterium]
MKTYFNLTFVVLAMAMVTGLFGCSAPEPILIGVAVELTGRQADVGINVRDAALMAADEVNARGGVNGRPLQLVVRDDQGLPEVARQVDAELVEMGVVAIIGHYTSGQTAAVLDQMNEAQVVLLSPSASSAAFSRRDDYFLRLIPDTSFVGRKLGEHIVNEHAARRLVGVYEENNRAFSESFWQAVEEVVRASGVETSGILFNSAASDLQQVAMQVRETNPDAVVIVASSVDTAVLAQYLRQMGVDVLLFSSPWAQTTQLLEKGGQAVEGMEIGALYNSNIQTEAHRDFVQAFEARFRRSPELGTAQAYECVMLLADALKATNGSRTGLREALLAIQNYPGLLGPISFDQYGDVQRNVYIMRVENGQIVEKETILSPKP